MNPVKLEFLIALRYLRTRRREGFISVISIFSFLGIFLGVATLIIVMSVMNGFREDLFARILGVKGHGEILSTQGSFPFHNNMLEGIMKIEGVRRAIPVLEGQVLFSTPKHALGGVLRGLRAEDLAAKPFLSEGLTPSLLAQFEQGQGLLIGAHMAAEFNLSAGDKITLTAPQPRYTAFGPVTRNKTMPVIGQFSTGMYEYDRYLAFLPLEQAGIFFNLPDKIHKIEIDSENAEKIDSLMADISANLVPGFYARSWKDVNGSFYEALAIERRVMFLILTLIILVAAFNIISGQVMLVRDKARSIAILRSMGASRRMILRIFFITGALIGLSGTLLGVGSGVVFTRNIEAIRRFIESGFNTKLFQVDIYYLSELPSRIEGNQILLIALMSLGLSFLAALYPAFKAGRLDPIDILRSET